MAEAVESPKSPQIIYRPIAYFKSDKKSRLQAPRQGIEDEFSSTGIIEFLPGNNFEQALEDLQGFTHLWIIFDFHLNKTWKTKVKPPRFANKKIGVFATRSPYRPNSVGLTAAKILKIQGRNILVGSTDLLDGSPILDIKPYLSFADSFPKAQNGWIGNGPKNLAKLKISKLAKSKIDWLETKGVADISSVLAQQLRSDPLNSSSKRVKRLNKTRNIFSLRKWRIFFRVKTDKSIFIEDIESNFIKKEKPHFEDSIHAEFLEAFPKI